MIMTELQYASLVISLSTLGQTATIEGLDIEELRNLDYLLEDARKNVRKVLLSELEKESTK